MAILVWLLTFTSVSIFVLVLTFLLLLVISLFAGKSIGDPNYAPVKGTVFHQLLYSNNLFDHQTETARTLRTFRLLGPGMSEHYTTDPRNMVEDASDVEAVKNSVINSSSASQQEKTTHHDTRSEGGAQKTNARRISPAAKLLILEHGLDASTLKSLNFFHDCRA